MNSPNNNLEETHKEQSTAKMSCSESPLSDALSEARRIMHICNICGYCNGFCDVFERASRRPALTATDLHYLANLCHHCRNCYYACQYAPPHALAVNVPRTLAEVRQQTYREYAWPQGLGQVFGRNGRIVGWLGLLSVLVSVGAGLTVIPGNVLFAVHQGPGAFYAIIPWHIMVMIAGLPLVWSTLAVGIGLARFARAIRRDERMPTPSIWQILGQTLKDSLSLRNLKGAGHGCNDRDDRYSHLRRRLHHALFYGILACLAATLTATAYHHILHRLAPYPILSLPVLLGTLGGVAMLAGSAGLAWLQRHADSVPAATIARSGERTVGWLLMALAGSGLALMLLRETPAMGLLLVMHLGLAATSLFLLPYGKLAHGPYRMAALWQAARERPG